MRRTFTAGIEHRYFTFQQGVLKPQFLSPDDHGLSSGVDQAKAEKLFHASLIPRS